MAQDSTPLSKSPPTQDTKRYCTRHEKVLQKGTATIFVQPSTLLWSQVVRPCPREACAPATPPPPLPPRTPFLKSFAGSGAGVLGSVGSIRGSEREAHISWPMVTCQGSARSELPWGLLALCWRALGSERHRYALAWPDELGTDPMAYGGFK